MFALQSAVLSRDAVELGRGSSITERCSLGRRKRQVSEAGVWDPESEGCFAVSPVRAQGPGHSGKVHCQHLGA